MVHPILLVAGACTVGAAVMATRGTAENAFSQISGMPPQPNLDRDIRQNPDDYHKSKTAFSRARASLEYYLPAVPPLMVLERFTDLRIRPSSYNIEIFVEVEYTIIRHKELGDTYLVKGGIVRTSGVWTNPLDIGPWFLSYRATIEQRNEIRMRAGDRAPSGLVEVNIENPNGGPANSIRISIGDGRSMRISMTRRG